MVQVIDNGPGVPTDLAGKIFFRWSPGEQAARAWGFSLAQQLVNQHQGLIEFESEPGRTCFTMILPMREMDAIAQAPRPPRRNCAPFTDCRSPHAPCLDHRR